MPATSPSSGSTTAQAIRDISSASARILSERENNANATLADLYDPSFMPKGLRMAHAELDAAVEAAYGVDFNGDEEKIVAHLFKLYAEKTGEEGQ
ncbi:type IIL restriction-modification enzyme MmeI [uncultured Parolsenella sp.]|uniref:type IIL restriction-modification enzyme MmeI n=1 Tax=uncultured Parolsenella sp. TaxID=2083008 RepID=UPI0034661D48